MRGPITQPPIGEHVWQSGQVCSAPPPQTPLVQVSPLLHASLSLHAVPFGLNVHVLEQHDAGVPFAGPCVAVLRVAGADVDGGCCRRGSSG